jgi:hypothetical protein
VAMFRYSSIPIRILQSIAWQSGHDQVNKNMGALQWDLPPIAKYSSPAP